MRLGVYLYVARNEIKTIGRVSADALCCDKGHRVYPFHNGWCVLLLVPLPKRETIVSDAARGPAGRKCDTYQRREFHSLTQITNSLLIFYKNYDIIFIES